ncbi:LCP family protein [Flaviflexus huanghaiensis]|uniref:LCP family protein n=1 Tax=Flaviflexus huanghaiensis TaxID=1111473 RepID=UPI0015F910D7|nr:LCP family protein [Flaviflexus huanghaiensis]
MRFFFATTLFLSACAGQAEAPLTPAASVYESAPTEDAAEENVEDEPLTVLLIGLDRDTGAQRADAILLVRINGEREHAAIMSIHRDTWVAIPGHGDAKINAAYADGGAELLADTVDMLYSARIDHTVAVDFDAFVTLSEMLGPITVSTSAGTVELAGDEALSFVRERSSLPGGDFDRVRRQQAYLAGVANALRDANAAERARTVAALSEHVTIGDEQTLPLGLLSDDLEMEFFSSTHGGTGWSADGQSIVLPGDIESLADAFEGDTVDEWLEMAGAQTLDSRPVR